MSGTDQPRPIATIRSGNRAIAISNGRLLSAANALAMVVGALTGIAPAMAQSAGGEKKQDLPPINVTAPGAKRTNSTPARHAGAGAARRRQQAARQVQPEIKPKEFGPSQDAKTGTVGVYSNSTPVATKSNTPIV